MVEKFIYVAAFKKNTNYETHLTVSISKKCAFCTSGQINPSYDFYLNCFHCIFLKLLFT